MIFFVLFIFIAGTSESASWHDDGYTLPPLLERNQARKTVQDKVPTLVSGRHQQTSLEGAPSLSKHTDTRSSQKSSLELGQWEDTLETEVGSFFHSLSGEFYFFPQARPIKKRFESDVCTYNKWGNCFYMLQKKAGAMPELVKPYDSFKMVLSFAGEADQKKMLRLDRTFSRPAFVSVLEEAGIYEDRKPWYGSFQSKALGEVIHTPDGVIAGEDILAEDFVIFGFSLRRGLSRLSFMKNLMKIDLAYAECTRQRKEVSQKKVHFARPFVTARYQ